MQTVNFSCPHCSNLMAVGITLLGRNVRCPHCKEVVQAPSSVPQSPPPAVAITPLPPTPSTPPTPTVPIPSPASAPIDFPAFDTPLPPKDEPDSIFGEVHDDDLFGSKQPKVEVPPDLALTPATIPLPQDLIPQRTVSAPPPPTPTVTQTFVEAPPQPPPPLPKPQPDAPPPNFWANQSTEPPTTSESTPLPRTTSRPAPTSGGNGPFVWIVLIYAIAVTVGGGWLLYEKLNSTPATTPAPENTKKTPFDAIPDFFGEYERSNRKKVSFHEGMPKIRDELPADLRVQLGDTLKVQSLEFTPLEVRFVSDLRAIRSDSKKPPTMRAYTLQFRVKNISEDVYLHPTDPAFNRRRTSSDLPYNGIFVAGTEPFFGGPFSWPPSPPTLRESIPGQEQDEVALAPGESRMCTISSSPDGKLVSAIASTDKPILWRVQLRSGLIHTPDANGQTREVSVTSVVGVEFTSNQVK